MEHIKASACWFKLTWKNVEGICPKWIHSQWAVQTIQMINFSVFHTDSISIVILSANMQ